MEEPLGLRSDLVAFGGIEEAGGEKSVADKERLPFVGAAVGALRPAAAGLEAGFIAEVFDGTQELALDGAGGAAAAGDKLIPDLAHQLGIAEMLGKYGLNGGRGMDGGTAGLPALHELLHFGGGGFEPAAGIHAIPVLLVEIGAEPEYFLEDAEISNPICPFPPEEPALDGPIDDV